TALLASASFSPFAGIAASALNMLLNGINNFVFSLNSLPFAHTEGISINGIQTLFLYLILIFILWFVEETKPRILIASLSTLLIYCSVVSFYQIERSEKKQVVVYAAPKEK